MREEILFFLIYHGYQPSLMECVISGSIMTIVDSNKNLKKKLDPNITTTGYYLGFANHCNVWLYFDPANPTKIKGSHHCIIDDIATLSLLMKAVTTPTFPLSRYQENDMTKAIISSMTIYISGSSWFLFFVLFLFFWMLIGRKKFFLLLITTFVFFVVQAIVSLLMLLLAIGTLCLFQYFSTRNASSMLLFPHPFKIAVFNHSFDVAVWNDSSRLQDLL